MIFGFRISVCSSQFPVNSVNCNLETNNYLIQNYNVINVKSIRISLYIRGILSRECFIQRLGPRLNMELFVNVVDMCSDCFKADG